MTNKKYSRSILFLLQSHKELTQHFAAIDEYKLDKHATLMYLLCPNTFIKLVGPELFQQIFFAPIQNFSLNNLCLDLIKDLQKHHFDTLIIPTATNELSAKDHFIKFATLLSTKEIVFFKTSTNKTIIPITKQLIRDATTFQNTKTPHQCEFSRPWVTSLSDISNDLAIIGNPQPLPKSEKYFPTSLLNTYSAHIHTFKDISMPAITLKCGHFHDLSCLLETQHQTLRLALIPKHNKIFENISLMLDGQEYSFEQLECGRWHNLPLNYTKNNNEERALQLHSHSSDLIVASPILMSQRHPTAKRIIILLIVDSLVQEVISNYSIESLMPCTSNFFSNGLAFTNCWAQGEWTLPCVGSMFTGLYPSKHGVYQPNCPGMFSHETPLLAELLREYGYLTSGFSSANRPHVTMGFARGLDTYLNMSSKVRHDREVIYSAIDQLKSFPDRSHFIFIHICKPHTFNTPNWSMETELSLSLKDRVVKAQDPNEKYSNSQQATSQMLARYAALIRESDRDLSSLYEYLKQNFSTDDVSVILTADHGVRSFAKESHVIANESIHVPLLVKDSDVQGGIDHSFVGNIDIFPNILNFAKIPIPQNIDGILWPVCGGTQRNHIITEAIYKCDYWLRIRDKNFVYSLHQNSRTGKLKLESMKRTLHKANDSSALNNILEETKIEILHQFSEIAEKHIDSIKEQQFKLDCKNEYPASKN